MDFGVWRSLVSRLVRVQEASGSNPDTPTMSSRTAYRSRRLFYKIVISHSFRRSSFPQKVTLGSPAQLQAPSQRLTVATNLLRVTMVQIHLQKTQNIFFVPIRHQIHRFCSIKAVKAVDFFCKGFQLPKINHFPNWGKTTQIPPPDPNLTQKGTVSRITAVPCILRKTSGTLTWHRKQKLFYYFSLST